MLSAIQPGQQPEQPTQPQPQQPEIPTPNPGQQPEQPNIPDELPERDIKRTPSNPDDVLVAAHDDVPADERMGPTKDYNPHGKGHFKDRFPFPNTRH